MTKPLHGFIVCVDLNGDPTLYMYTPQRAVELRWNDQPAHGYECSLIALLGTGVDHVRSVVFQNDMALHSGRTPGEALTNGLIEKSRCLAFWEALNMPPKSRAARELQALLQLCL